MGTGEITTAREESDRGRTKNAENLLRTEKRRASSIEKHIEEGEWLTLTHQMTVRKRKN